MRSCAKAVLGPRVPTNEACTVFLMAYFEPPVSWSHAKRAKALSGELRHRSKPDADNIGKLVLDAMNGIVYRDDCQVDLVTAGKRYGSPARVEVMII